MLKRLSAILLLSLAACSQNSGNKDEQKIPVIGFADAFEDNTIAQARKGFTDALADSGFSEKANTLKIEYRNAQGNIPTLTQIVKYFISEEVTLIATCPSLPTITAVQSTKTIPVFMMVAPMPSLMKIESKDGAAPANLYGVGDNLDYIDTSFTLIAKLAKPKAAKLSVGMLYNQAEPQSVDALNRIKKLAAAQNVTLVALPVNSSADAQMVTRSLLGKGIDAFFANPDNTVFAAFETILKACNEANVPVFTSESGLVARGAVAAYGADIYQWGYQSGAMAATYLKSGATQKPQVEMVKLRNRVYNAEAVKRFGIAVPADFVPVDSHP